MAENQSTEFTSVKHALETWPSLRDHQEVWADVIAVIDQISKILGRVTRVHIPVAQGYVAVTFAGEPSKIGAYIAHGYVDHIVEIPGSFLRVPDAPYWRSELSTAQQGQITKTPSSSPEFVVCPTCGIRVPVYGECACGWVPISRQE